MAFTCQLQSISWCPKFSLSSWRFRQDSFGIHSSKLWFVEGCGLSTSAVNCNMPSFQFFNFLSTSTFLSLLSLSSLALVYFYLTLSPHHFLSPLILDVFQQSTLMPYPAKFASPRPSTNSSCSPRALNCNEKSHICSVIWQKFIIFFTWYLSHTDFNNVGMSDFWAKQTLLTQTKG